MDWRVIYITWEIVRNTLYVCISEVNMITLAFLYLIRRPLTYSWQRQDGRPFEPGTQLSDLNRVLTIPDAHIEAEGDYVCTVSGRVGVTTEVVTLTIEGIYNNDV